MAQNKGTNDIRVGVITYYNDVKRYGFLKDNISQSEYFFHVTGLLCNRIETDDKISFKIGEYHNKPVAIEINKI